MTILQTTSCDPSQVADEILFTNENGCAVWSSSSPATAQVTHTIAETTCDPGRR
ncbi:MAG: hypothetical protein H6568_12160 [Lewinellaceae bacterium]|nr:hypothetical protein [Lewinellaceae bacterium]